MRLCTIDGCNRKHMARGLCSTHYSRTLTGQSLTDPVRQRINAWGPWKLNNTGYLIRYRSIIGTKLKEHQLQHRVVMAEVIGRELYSHETVHHINGDRTDNHPENLELWSSMQPSGQRVEDKLSWAREIIKLYGDESE